MEIKTKLASGYYTIEFIDDSTVMNPGLMDQKEANEMAKKLFEAADYLRGDE